MLFNFILHQPDMIMRLTAEIINLNYLVTTTRAIYQTKTKHFLLRFGVLEGESVSFERV